MKIQSEKKKWFAAWVKNPHNPRQGFHAPVFEQDGKLFAYLEEVPFTGQTEGTNICRTGGPRSLGAEPEGKNWIEVPFYDEYFNAGGGRVSAGIEGKLFLPKGEINAHEVERF